MADKGWIKLHRQLQECPIWYGERFSKGQAWVDLLLLANHRDKKIIFNGEMITIQRGQYLTSTVKLAEKWGWNRKTVSSYLNMLQKENMITKVSDNTRTLVTIENYEKYQGSKPKVGNQMGNQMGSQRAISRANTGQQSKNIKNIENGRFPNGETAEERKKRLEELRNQ